ncbi:hypoxanthine phosphoribosyltransferase [Novosphingobium capsulatum]|uniref:Hypoxanthine phosphoribosyltransferase n=1 Tax=Novosphingobium capsulatum TaxID=13688 RepID=A0ABU1MHX7_9SPHN|nr:phosphoribosyltransferase domain-containing protein [Novosphingobium capsulatum]MDR6509909.1 hypoxanthine phosphoribosyltransferase [Novosphingobium capsulatum]
MTQPVFDYIAYDDFLAIVRTLSQTVGTGDWKPDFVVGIGRGGLVPAVYMSQILNVPMLSIDQSAKVPGFADELLVKLATMTKAGQRILIIDDINDSGRTIAQVRRLLRAHDTVEDNLRFAVMINNAVSQETVDYAVQTIDRTTDKRWFVFPWEAVATAETLTGQANEVPERLA